MTFPPLIKHYFLNLNCKCKSYKTCLDSHLDLTVPCFSILNLTSFFYSHFPDFWTNFKKKKFYGRIIALQNFVVFCQTWTWISHRYTYISSLLNLPPHFPPHPTPLGWYRAPVWVSWAIQQIHIGFLFYIWQCKFPCYSFFYVILSIHLTLSSPLHVSISLSSFSVSPLLPCK